MASEDEDTATSDERPPGSRGRARLSSERYQVGDRIGRGGMGEVLIAHDAQIGREVAIKRMRAATPSERQVARFLREARIQGRLEHPAIVPVHEIGRDGDGLPFFAMKKLAGTTLAAILESRDRERFPRQRLLRAFGEVCLAAEYAHVHGVIHRDLKPENIVLGDFGEVYVLDWGVAKVVGEADELLTDLAVPGGTLAGTAMGTPGFMAPEQARGEGDLDARADVFALGRVLGLILERDLEPPPELETLRDRATDDSRETRLATARELGEGVQRYLDGDRDLALRGHLARDHFERARSAFERGDQRALAMREAGRALALDPQLPGAAELVSRLMLEPPRELPAEVRAAITADDHRVERAVARSGFIAHFAILAALPMLLGAGELAHAVALAACATLSATVTALVSRGRQLPLKLLAVMALPLIAVVCWLYSPIVAAGLAGLIGFLLASNPRIPDRRGAALAIIALLSPVILPAIGELLGLLPQTFFVDADGFRLASPAFGGHAALVYGVIILFIGALVMMCAVTGRTIRVSERALRHQLQIQTWQLAQLAPASPA